MKYHWLSALLIVLVAIAAGGATYHFTRPATTPARAPKGTAAAQDDLEWLQREFKLTPEQLRQIEAAHGAYQTECRQHRARLGAQRGALADARAKHRPAQEITAAQETIASTKAVCRSDAASYAREIAAIIGGTEGERYLSIVLPRLTACFGRQEGGGGPPSWAGPPPWAGGAKRGQRSAPATQNPSNQNHEPPAGN